jgi:antitoxin component YwqK of YwqJK toxin-antitoxin module
VVTIKIIAAVLSSFLFLPAVWAGMICPAGSQYRSEKKAESLFEWCQTIGSDNKVIRVGSYQRTSEHFKIVGQYLDGKKVGTWKVLDPQDGLLAESAWDDDKANGTALVNNKPDSAASEGAYVLGVRDGKWRTRYSSGRPLSEVEYKNGEKDGRELLQNEEGIAVQEADYTHGELKHLVRYYPSGNKYTDEQYSNPSSYKWSVWTDEGQLVLEGSYKENHPDGKWTRWDASGKVLREATFSDGKIVSDSGSSVAFDDPALMMKSTPTQRLSENSSRSYFNTLGFTMFLTGAASLTSGIYSLNNIHPVRYGQTELDSLGLLSALEGGLYTLIGGAFTVFGDDLYEGWNQIKERASSTHEDRLLREREAELRLREIHHGYEFLMAFSTKFLVLLNGATLWRAHNVGCHSCVVAAAVATGVSFTPLLTYYSREQSGYRDLKEDKKSIFSPTPSIAVIPNSTAPLYAFALKWDW